MYTINFTLLRSTGDSLVVQWLGLKVPMLGVWVRSLVEGLRAHEMYDEAKKKKKKKKERKDRWFNSFQHVYKVVQLSLH